MAYTIEKDWTTEAGLRAVVILGDMGHRCGYVGVPHDHPLYKHGYDAPHVALKMNMNRSTEKMGPIQILCAMGKDPDQLCSPEYVFEVHGGITFSGGNGEYPVKSDLWWFGYDCGHAGDLPEPDSTMGRMYAEHGFAERDGVLRTLDFCIGECESLAKQLAEVVP